MGPRVTEESWMFIRTDRIAWVAQALLITWKEFKCSTLTLSLFWVRILFKVKVKIQKMKEDLLGKEDAFEPAILNNTP